MNRNKPLIELVTIIAKRSICAVQVGALIYDNKLRVISWGWNHSGISGMGMHAEDHAIRRSNKTRLNNSTIIVLSIRRSHIINSFPCPNCYSKIVSSGIRYVECNNHNREWMKYRI